MHSRIAFAVLVSIVALLGTGAVAYLSTTVPSISGPGYTAHIEPEGEGALWIHINVDVGRFDTYRDGNAQRIQALISRGWDERIPVQVTFARPIAIDEARALAAATQLEVESYLLGGRNGDSQRTTHVYLDTFKDHPAQVIGPSDQRSRLLGVLVVKGTVPSSPPGLGVLAGDPRVYIADVTPAVVMEEVRKRRIWAGRAIAAVGADSPLWSLDTW